MRKRIMSLLLCLIMALSLLPATAVTAFAAAPTGKAVLGGFTAGGKAGDAYIQNDGMTILDAAGTGGNNPMTTYGSVGQTATLSPYCPPYGRTLHPEYVYNDYNATAIIAEETGRRLLTNDTFKAGTTYRFTFQDTSWPVTSIIKGGGYLGELDASNFTISGASVVKVERVVQKISATEEREVQGFFYNVWITIDGTQPDYAVQYASNNVTVAGLSRTDSSTTPAKTGYAKEGDRITLTAAKMKEGYFFTGWKFTTTDDNKFYTDKDYIQWYCNVTDYASNESGSDRVTCSFRMGDKNLKVEALYGRPGSAGVGNVTFNNVKLWVMPPVKGAKGVTAVVPEFDVLGTTYQIGKVEWLEDTETGSPNYLGMDSSKTFDTANKCYTMRVVLKLKDGYAFSDKNGVTITINDKTYGTGTETPLYSRENRTIPVTYNYSETNKSLAIYISVGGDGVKTRLEDRYKAYAALNFVDAPSIDSVTVTDASNTSYGTMTDNNFTKALEQGINYDVQVKVRVPKAVQDAIDRGLMQLQPQFRYLLQGSLAGENLWQGTQVTKTTDTATGDTIYTYSTVGFGPVAGESYNLVFGTNLVTTGANAQRIAGNVITGTFEGIAAQTISGAVYYTNSSVYGKTMTTGPIIYKPDGTRAADAELRFQWQRKMHGGTWEDIAGATGGQYMMNSAGETIRVVVTANGYKGAVYGAAVTVGKASQTAPARPNVSTADPWTTITINGYDGEAYEYYCAEDAATPGAPISFGADGKASVSERTAYNVYARLKETATHNASPWSKAASIYTGNNLHSLTLADRDGNEYPGKDLVGGIHRHRLYVEKGANEYFNVVKTPVDATSWTAFKFDNYAGGLSHCTVDNTASITAPNMPGGITITGNSVGTDTLKAYYQDGPSSYSIYGEWQVVVYDGTVTSINVNDLDITERVLDDITLNVGDTYTVTKDVSLVDVYPAGAVTEERLSWKVNTSTTTTPDYKDANGYLKIEDGKITALQKTEGVHDNLHTVYLLVNGTKVAASFKVNVTEITGPTDLAVTPAHLTLKADEISVLSAVKTPLDAPGAVTWSSSNTAVATVEAATGKVTAVAAGTATITAACGGKTAACTVKVIAADHTHTFGSWTYLNDAVHYRTCDCGATEMKEHTWTQTAKTDATTEAAGSVTYKCRACGAERTEVIPQLTADPGEDGVHTHTYGTAWKSDDTNHWKECTDTSCPDLAGSVKDKAAHTASAWIIDRAATRTTEGSKHKECSVCKKVLETATIPAKGGTSGGSTSGGSTITGRKSAVTADPGILLYGVMALSSYTGTALLVRGRKKHD